MYVVHLNVSLIWLKCAALRKYSRLTSYINRGEWGTVDLSTLHSRPPLIIYLFLNFKSFSFMLMDYSTGLITYTLQNTSLAQNEPFYPNRLF